jgi:hypothetical protein
VQAREELEADPEYAGLDLSDLKPDWTSKKGFYAPDVPSLQARARWNRRWLRERPEKEIVVVAHGDCLRYITEGYNSGKPWANTGKHAAHIPPHTTQWLNPEVRVYTFASEDDDDAKVIAVGKAAQQGSDEPTSSGFAPNSSTY